MMGRYIWHFLSRFTFAALAWALAIFVDPMIGVLMIVVYLGYLDAKYDAYEQEQKRSKAP